MTGQEKILEVIEQVNEIKNNIQKKYDKIMGKIAEYQEKLNEVIQNAQKNSEIWVEKQKKKIMNKKVREGIIGYAFASLWLIGILGFIIFKNII